MQGRLEASKERWLSEEVAERSRQGRLKTSKERGKFEWEMSLDRIITEEVSTTHNYLSLTYYAI